MNEHEAIVTSLNLHEFSQQNNIEMGFHIKNCGTGKQAYSEILREVGRLIKPKLTKAVEIKPNSPIPIETLPLAEGKKYSANELEKFFKFGRQGGGIRKASNGAVVLFCNTSSNYPNREEDGIIYYCCHDTGTRPQKLEGGNLLLYNCYENKSVIIHFLKDSIYKGKYHIKLKPYLETGIWIFPLVRSP